MKPEPPITRDDLPLTAAEAAKLLGIESERLIDAAKRGRIGHVKLPIEGAYLFPLADLLVWCDRHRREADIDTTSRRAG